MKKILGIASGLLLAAVPLCAAKLDENVMRIINSGQGKLNSVMLGKVRGYAADLTKEYEKGKAFNQAEYDQIRTIEQYLKNNNYRDTTTRAVTKLSDILRQKRMDMRGGGAGTLGEIVPGEDIKIDEPKPGRVFPTKPLPPIPTKEEPIKSEKPVVEDPKLVIAEVSKLPTPYIEYTLGAFPETIDGMKNYAAAQYLGALSADPAWKFEQFEKETQDLAQQLYSQGIDNAYALSLVLSEAIELAIAGLGATDRQKAKKILTSSMAKGLTDPKFHRRVILKIPGITSQKFESDKAAWIDRETKGRQEVVKRLEEEIQELDKTQLEGLIEKHTAKDYPALSKLTPRQQVVLVTLAETNKTDMLFAGTKTSILGGWLDWLGDKKTVINQGRRNFLEQAYFDLADRANVAWAYEYGKVDPRRVDRGAAIALFKDGLRVAAIKQLVAEGKDPNEANIKEKLAPFDDKTIRTIIDDFDKIKFDILKINPDA